MTTTSTSKFKAGNKVRINGASLGRHGQEGVIRQIDEGSTWPVLVRFADNDDSYYGLGELVLLEAPVEEAVVHPAHYGGDTTYEVIKVAEAWELDKDAYLFNVVKYVARAGKKGKATLLQDLKKARFYLDRRIKALEDAVE